MDKIPGYVWVLLILVVLYFLAQKAAKATASLGKEAGYGIGKGATDTLLSSKGVEALGSFLGGLFSSKKESASMSDDVGEYEGPGGYDTSSFRVYED